MDNIINNTIKASEIHKNIRHELKDFIKPGIKLLDICEFIENKIRESSSNQINSGIAFPTGVSLNNIAAHWTPMKKTDNTILNTNDVLKIDFGVHNDGCIVDSAFTWTDNNRYDPLLEASKESVYTIIKNIGVDTKISEIGEIAEEIISSYEIELDGKTIPIKPINNLCGHNIKPWTIHGGKLIYPIKNNCNTVIEDDDILAIEIFTSTGKGTTILDDRSSHYMLNSNICSDSVALNNLKHEKSKKLFNIINSNFKTLPFTQRYLDYCQNDIKHYGKFLNDLFNNGIIKSYPALIDPEVNSYTAQFEHTIYVSETRKINFSIGDDY
jgi:methionyl aminopeptidase